MPATLETQRHLDADTDAADERATSVATAVTDSTSTGRTAATQWHFPPLKTPLGEQRSTDVGRYITSAVAVTLTSMALGAVVVGAAGWADVSPFPVIASAVFVLFAGLFARVRFGGGRRTAVVGALLLPVVALCATAAPHLDEGVGDRSYAPTSFDDVESDYSFGIGNLVVDLRDVDFPPGEHTIKIEHGIGAARVQLPADVSYAVSGNVGIGKLDLLDETDDGFNTTLDAETGEADGIEIVVEFDISIGYGAVDVD